MKQISLIKSGLWITYSTFLLRFFALLSNLVLARLLLPSDFGVIGVAYVFWSFFTLFTQSTTGSFIVYKGTEDKRYLNTTYTISLYIGVSFAVAMIATAPLVANFFHQPNLTWILIVFAFNLVLSSILYVYSGIMTRQMQYQEQANITLISSITRLLCTTGSALAGLSYWSFVIGDTASWIVGCILCRYKSGHRLRLEINPEVKSEVLSFCLGATGSSFGFYVNANVDNLVVGKVLGNASLGYYNLAYQLTMALSTIFNSVIGQLGTPIFAQLTDEKEQENALFNVVEQVAFITAPIYALILLTLDKSLITLAFGAKWTPMTIVIPGLLVFAYFRVINSPLDSMLSAKGRPDINAKVNLYIAPIAVFGFVFGAKYAGILGVSVAVASILGFVWTFSWWLAGCKQFNWSMRRFLLSCFIPVLLIILPLVISINLPLILKQIVFVLIYILSIKFILPRQFIKYQIVASQSARFLKEKLGY
ncbi:lipopolysaccharide biosynthesis protein [Aetokthonos hydrillicola Thurmond2011]|jgi:O-antigen/teichoic acid export membrane protein|uniref:Lipopolysaccharide biosynthesis protein n=1 Tax=Aetokthonos hydrillicola Thurmond2011 TaxID=2712845 RepID=A0AAP5M8I7_9CYAN|nr:lipopolysaccharide biosynthesis protein [Aetokthonos hydrillicola]MBO3457551.1 lipopolysaccharide biosynthesis protein [Aetokthonos hydrillicola CCALA 1050]MBW4590761.1 lipopolysaccharide biosynthesis protein [Aetokthonos hydrillicola CCALA 1050]MDR9894767.1 lipopolysaccharide biosynthesis protein [Aetokthonos hydrillicola Thurmond2011]